MNPALKAGLVGVAVLIGRRMLEPRLLPHLPFLLRWRVLLDGAQVLAGLQLPDGPVRDGVVVSGVVSGVDNLGVDFLSLDLV